MLLFGKILPELQFRSQPLLTYTAPKVRTEMEKLALSHNAPLPWNALQKTVRLEGTV